MSTAKATRLSNEVPSEPPAYDQLESSEPAQLLSSQLAGASISELDVRSQVPNVSQTICHLKLLNAIHRLKERISQTDGLFGLFDLPQDEPSDSFDDLKHARVLLRLRIREKRWAVYVQRAADRFSRWWRAMRKTSKDRHMLNVGRLRGEQGEVLSCVRQDNSAAPDWLHGKLPPLGICDGTR